MAITLDADEVIIGTADGPGIYIAPPATAMPTDLDAIDTAWKLVGYLSEDGPVFNQEVETGEIVPWQGKTPVRKYVESRTYTVEFVMIQVNEATASMWLDQPTPTATAGSFDMPIRDDVPQRSYAVLIVVKDGNIQLALHFLEAVLEEAGEMGLPKTGAVELPVTLSALGDGGLVGNVKKVVTP